MAETITKRYKTSLLLLTIQSYIFLVASTVFLFFIGRSLDNFFIAIIFAITLFVVLFILSYVIKMTRKLITFDGLEKPFTDVIKIVYTYIFIFIYFIFSVIVEGSNDLKTIIIILIGFILLAVIPLYYIFNHIKLERFNINIEQ